MDNEKLERIRRQIKEWEQRVQMFSAGTTRKTECMRELQRLKNIEYKLIQEEKNK